MAGLLGKGLCLALVGLLAASTPSLALGEENLRGTLFICGGSMSDENPVWEEFARQSGQKGVAVIPTASGVPERSGPGTAELFEAFTESVRVIDVTIHNPENADRADLAEEVLNAGGVFFTGGDQSRLTDIYYSSDGSKKPVLSSVWEVLNRGGIVGGTSAGAACQSKIMLTGGTSADSLKTGPDKTAEKGVGFVSGLGFFPWGIIDQHHIARGRLGRLVIALQATGKPYGYGIDEDSVLVVDRSSAKGKVFSGQLLMVDVSGMTGGPGVGVENVGIRFLQEGDQIDHKTGEVTGDQYREDDSINSEFFEKKVEDIWLRGVLEGALNESLSQRAQGLDLLDETFRLRIFFSRLASRNGERPSLLDGTLEIELLE